MVSYNLEYKIYCKLNKYVYFTIYNDLAKEMKINFDIGSNDLDDDINNYTSEPSIIVGSILLFPQMKGR